MAANFYIKQNDTAPAIEAVLTDSNGRAKSLFAIPVRNPSRRNPRLVKSVANTNYHAKSDRMSHKHLGI